MVRGTVHSICFFWLYRQPLFQRSSERLKHVCSGTGAVWSFTSCDWWRSYSDKRAADYAKSTRTVTTFSNACNVTFALLHERLLKHLQQSKTFVHQAFSRRPYSSSSLAALPATERCAPAGHSRAPLPPAHLGCWTSSSNRGNEYCPHGGGPSSALFLLLFL